MIKLTNVSLRRGPRILFDEVNLTLHQGMRTGVTGANGVGKTSLFALLEGQLHTDSGDISLSPSLEIASVRQEVEAVTESALDYVMAGDRALMAAHRKLAQAEQDDDGHALALAHETIAHIDGYSAETRAARLLAGLGFSDAEQAQSFAAFSGGWRMRLNLARALMCRSDLLLLDEPTNHLDLDAIIWLERWLRDYPGMLLLISHDRDFLDAVCTHIVHIEQQKAGLYTGTYSEFEQQRAARLAGQQAAFVKQQREIAHMQKFVERFRAKATKARQAQSRLKALARLELIAPAHIDSPFTFAFEEPEKTPNQLVSVQKADFGYTNKAVLRGVTFNITPGERIGLLGANGAGKSTLIKALVGELAPMGGAVERARDLNAAYFAQHQVEQLRGEESPLSFLQRLEPRAAESTLRKHLGGFNFPGDTALGPIAPLSGGEKARLVLAAIIRRKPNLLLLDEPTNHLDLEMRHALGIALQSYDGALVVVSHDRYLLQSVCDTLMLVHDGRVDDFDGDLDSYARLLLKSRGDMQAGDAQADDPKGSSKNKRDRKRQEAEARNRLSRLRKEVRAREDSIQSAENGLAEIEVILGDNALYSEERQAELDELLARRNRLRQQLQTAESEWLEFSEALDTLQRS